MNKLVYAAKGFFRNGFPLFTMQKTRNNPVEFAPETARVGEREFYKIFYIEDGEGDLVINGKKYHISPGFVGVIHPNDLTTYQLTAEIGLYNILFFRSFLGAELDGLRKSSRFFDIFKESPDRTIQHDLLHLLDANRSILALIRRMELEFLSNEPDSEFLIRLYLLELLVKLSRLSTKNYSRKRHGDLVRMIREFLREHSERHVSMEMLSREFGLSAGHIHLLFKKETGTTIGSELLNLRIEKAKQLLKTSGLSVEKIAYRCGFSDPGNFYKQFRRETGTVPGTFRENKEIFKKNLTRGDSAFKL